MWIKANDNCVSEDINTKKEPERLSGERLHRLLLLGVWSKGIQTSSNSFSTPTKLVRFLSESSEASLSINY